MIEYKKLNISFSYFQIKHLSKSCGFQKFSNVVKLSCMVLRETHLVSTVHDAAKTIFHMVENSFKNTVYVCKDFISW